MADRVVNGNTHTENGWRLVDPGSCEWVRIAGSDNVTLQIREGQPVKIMGAFAADYNAFIERLRDADSACYTESNSVLGTPGRNNGSNHMSATGMDLNWEGPNRSRFRYGITKEQAYPGGAARELDDLLAFYEGMIFCGGFWSIRDWMHFQMGGQTYGSANFARVESFISRKIRPDGFSTYRRGGVGTAPAEPANPIKPTSGLTGRVLWELAGRPDRMPLARYEELLPLVEEMFIRCGANTIDRRAMMLSQLYPESGALYYKREIADGSAYEGRIDLGNTQPGDGRRFRGRGWIQLTGRAHTTGFSAWMFRQGLVPTATHLVEHPEEIETDRNSMLAVVYYWTVSRPQLNALADARNIEGATRAVNGGLTHIDERRRVYNAALAINANLLPAVSSDPWEELMALSVPSLSIYADPAEKDVPIPTMIAALDAHGPHEPWVEKSARLGDVDSIRRVARTANGQGRKGTGDTPLAIAQARDVFASIDPALIRAAIPTPS